MFLVLIHVHPRFHLAPFETFIVIIITSYPTSSYSHPTRSWYIGLLHRLSSAFLGLWCGVSFIFHFRWIPQSIHMHFSHESYPLTPSLFTFTTARVSYPRYSFTKSLNWLQAGVRHTMAWDRNGPQPVVYSRPVIDLRGVSFLLNYYPENAEDSLCSGRAMVLLHFHLSLAVTVCGFRNPTRSRPSSLCRFFVDLCNRLLMRTTNS